MLTVLVWLVFNVIKETEIFPLIASRPRAKPKIMLSAFFFVESYEGVIKTGKPFHHVSTSASITADREEETRDVR